MAKPAGAIDDGFQGWYRLHARLVQNPVNIGCPSKEEYTHPVYVHYISGRIRQFGDPVSELARRFRYVRGEEFPWQHTRGRKFVLQYDPSTDRAFGIKHGPQCIWGVHLIP